MEKVAERISHVFGVDYFIFTGPINGRVEIVTMELLLKISNQFLDRGEPIVAIAFTKESVDDMDILGEASQLDRGAWVRWSDDLQRVTITALHELGHLCDAEHCINESCIMFYTYKEHSKFSFDELYCERCRATVRGSWVYNRLVQASTDRAKKMRVLPKIVESTPLNLTEPSKYASSSSSENPVTNGNPPFPDWILASIDKEEFIRRVREHFGCEKEKY